MNYRKRINISLLKVLNLIRNRLKMKENLFQKELSDDFTRMNLMIEYFPKFFRIFRYHATFFLV